MRRELEQEEERRMASEPRKETPSKSDLPRDLPIALIWENDNRINEQHCTNQPGRQEETNRKAEPTPTPPNLLHKLLVVISKHEEPQRETKSTQTDEEWQTLLKEGRPFVVLFDQDKTPRINYLCPK